MKLAIVFDVLAPLEFLDTPLVNLRNKKFSKVVLLCIDETIIFTTNEKEHKTNIELCKKSICGDKICIEIHREHIQWIDHGKLNILPFASINRWVIE